MKQLHFDSALPLPKVLARLDQHIAQLEAQRDRILQGQALAFSAAQPKPASSQPVYLCNGHRSQRKRHQA